jgi:hypothetical protein
MTMTRAILAILALIASPWPAGAQSISDVLDFLLTDQSVQTGSAERDRAAAEATRAALSRALLANLATLPMGTSSTAFIYRLNPALGTVERATRSFGPLFSDRALTIGRHAGSVGVTFQHYRFTALDGHNLRDGSLITLANRFVDEAAPFDVDQLTLNLDADIATLSGRVGLSDFVEIGLAVPVVVLRVEGARINVYRGQTFTQAAAEATSIGFADTIVRAKVGLVRSEGRAVAVAADIRLPTGREENLLGSGDRAFRLSGIMSSERGRLSTYASGGWTFGGFAGGELNYAGAIAVAAPDRVTWTAELLGRVAGDGRIVAVAAPHARLNGVETIRLQPDRSRLYTLSVAPGVKWNLSDTWIVSASVALPFTSGGLTTRFTPFFGVDYGL